ncbi:Uncharacterised protein [Mycobacteroides abscessus subsp. abscessus]|nr:Uncharacterised protein [Mycobacteroides abscessus subsp. abscessus]
MKVWLHTMATSAIVIHPHTHEVRHRGGIEKVSAPNTAAVP